MCWALGLPGFLTHFSMHSPDLHWPDDLAQVFLSHCNTFSSFRATRRGGVTAVASVVSLSQAEYVCSVSQKQK